MNRLFLPVPTVPTALYEVANEVEDVFDCLFNANSDKEEALPSLYVAPLDIYEHDGCIEILMDFPGMPASNIRVEAKEDTLTISGERSSPPIQDGSKPCHRSIAYGKFQRMIQLPETANTNAIEASFDFGVLRVIVPKMSKSAPKLIQVRTAEPASLAHSQ